MTWEQQVRDRVDRVLAGGDHTRIVGSTSVRAAAGLILRQLEGVTTLTEAQAWEYLGFGNRKLVAELRDEYADRSARWRESIQ